MDAMNVDEEALRRKKGKSVVGNDWRDQASDNAPWVRKNSMTMGEHE